MSRSLRSCCEASTSGITRPGRFWKVESGWVHICKCILTHFILLFFKVTVEDAKCVQTNAYVKSDIFQEYHLKPGGEEEEEEEDISFSVNLGTVLECLNMFGGTGVEGAAGSPNLKMCYAGYGHPLILLLEEQGVVSDCKIRTREPEPCLDFNFATANIVSKVIMKSEYLKDVFTELDTLSEMVELRVSPTDKTFRVATLSPAGECEATVPDSSDMVEHFTSNATSQARYKLGMIRHGLKPLALSDRVSLRMDDREFLCLQYILNTEKGNVFLEFYCAPDEEEPER